MRRGHLHWSCWCSISALNDRHRRRLHTAVDPGAYKEEACGCRHVYIDTWDMWNRRNEFDGYVRARAHEVFASEYAVVPDGGWGNLKVRSTESLLLAACWSLVVPLPLFLAPTFVILVARAAHAHYLEPE